MRAWPGIVSLLYWIAAAAFASDLPVATDLERDAAQATRNGTPILVFFAASSCPYCREVEELYLEPMWNRGDYAGRLLIRVIDLESSRMLRDFTGRSVTHAGFARGQRISFTPTIRIYGSRGEQLVPQLVGYSSPDFYAGYLERAIEESLRRLKGS